MREAAHVILKRGLSKNIRQDYDGRVCARGAICIAAGLDADHPLPMGYDDGTGILVFNDREAESAHDVASLLMSEAEVIDE